MSGGDEENRVGTDKICWKKREEANFMCLGISDGWRSHNGGKMGMLLQTERSGSGEGVVTKKREETTSKPIREKGRGCKTSSNPDNDWKKREGGTISSITNSENCELCANSHQGSKALWAFPAPWGWIQQARVDELGGHRDGGVEQTTCMCELNRPLSIGEVIDTAFGIPTPAEWCG